MDLGKRTSYTYFMCNESNTVVYVGVTTNLRRRVWQHKNKAFRAYNSKHSCRKLVYYEVFSHILDAIAREKQLKACDSRNKMKLVDAVNPGWNDLADTGFGVEIPS